MSICHILVTALGRLASCYMQMKNFEDAERLYTKELIWTRERGGDDRSISNGMCSVLLLESDFLLI